MELNGKNDQNLLKVENLKLIKSEDWIVNRIFTLLILLLVRKLKIGWI
jgi:hypothetical protein